MNHRRGSGNSNIHDSSTSNHSHLDDSFLSCDSVSSSLSEQVDCEAELVIYKAEAYYGNHFFKCVPMINWLPEVGRVTFRKILGTDEECMNQTRLVLVCSLTED